MQLSWCGRISAGASAWRLLVTASLGILLCGAGTNANDPSQGFGNPPSGEYPILFNDHTVYARPDILKQNRVLAALVRNGVMYVPLRSMFEQMGATVTVSDDGQTITAAKSGASVSVTLGKSEVVVNGEVRPLDVPPMVYEGDILVPVRVLSEALGAYVQWVPERQLVVVRYNPAPAPLPPVTPTKAPTAVPTEAPTPVPTVAPTPVPEKPTNRGFIQAAYGLGGSHNFNEFSAGNYCANSTFSVSGAYIFKHSPFAVKVDYRQDGYVTSENLVDAGGNHYTQFATIDGGTAITPVFLAQQASLDGRIEYKVADPRIYIGVGYLSASNNYGYPRLTGFGAGLEKLPDFTSVFSLYGSAFYYPNASGNYTVSNPASVNDGVGFHQRYEIVKYDIGLAIAPTHFPVYLYGGFGGDRYYAKQSAPLGQIHAGPYLGVGLKL
jgi:hypothetical protein